MTTISSVDTSSPGLRLNCQGTRLLDGGGREVILRGVNAGGRAKTPPFFPFDFEPEHFERACARYFDRLIDWGINVVRLPFSWEALEPTRGAYDTRFLERYKHMAAACGERGLRVIVDFHQDVFARCYSGDGFPLWACPEPSVMSPSSEVHTWYAGYLLHPDVRRAFTRFWHNRDGLRDAFKAMWRLMAEALWTVDAVIGFEIINEPFWGGSPRKNWGSDVLTPFYEEMAEHLQSVAPGCLVFFGPSGFDGVLGTLHLSRPQGSNLVFAPHFYGPDLMIKQRCLRDSDIAAGLARWADIGAEWRVPVFVGEFGISPDVRGAAGHIRAHFDAFDALHLHGALWEYSTSRADWNHENLSLCDAKGRERATVPGLVRPYPAALSGSLITFEYDAHTRRASFIFDAEPGTSEVVLPERCYPLPPHVSTLPTAGLASEVQEGRLLLHVTHPGRVRVEIYPAV